MHNHAELFSAALEFSQRIGRDDCPRRPPRPVLTLILLAFRS
jgi:hypothetical protein